MTADSDLMKRALCVLFPILLLAGCDQLGIDTPAKLAAIKEAEGKAIGSACRHAMRAIEDCYTLNPKAVKSAVYTGWREMDEYMRDNKIEGIAPVVPRPDNSKKPKPGNEEVEVVEPRASDSKSEGKSEGKADSKSEGKDAGKAR